MQNYPIATQSPTATPVGTASCAICRVPVGFGESAVAHLTGAVFAHESCAFSFARPSTKVSGGIRGALARF